MKGPEGPQLKGFIGFQPRAFSLDCFHSLGFASQSNVTMKAICPTLQCLSNVAAINHPETGSVCQDHANQFEMIQKTLFRQIAPTFLDILGAKEVIKTGC